MYMQFLFFFLVGLWFLIRFVKNPSGGNLVVLTAAHVLLLYTHFLSFVVVLLEVLVYYGAYLQQKNRGVEEFPFKARFDLSRFGLFLIILTASYIPWMRVFVGQVQYLLTFVLKEKFLLKFGFDGFYYFFAGAVITFILGLWALYTIFCSENKPSQLLKLPNINIPSWLFILSFVLFLIFNWKNADYYFGNVTYIRYLIFFVPLLHIFLAAQMMKLPRKWFVALFVVYIVVTSSILVEYYRVDGKEQWREAAAYMQDTVGDDVLLFHTSGHTWWAFNYYFNGNVTQVRLKYDEPLDSLYDGLRGKEYAYLILSHNFRQPTFFNELLDQQYEVVDKKEFIGVTIYKYNVGQDK